MGGNSYSRIGNGADKEAYDKRREIESHIARFVKSHCDIAPHYFVPAKLIHDAWYTYRELHNVDPLVDEFVEKGYVELIGKDITFHPEARFDAHNQMYFGIQLNSWPGCLKDVC
jgi:hypothetical protein